MKVTHLFSRQSRLALAATPGRNVFTWGVILLVIVVGFVFPGLLPWWGWLLVVLVEFVGLAWLGRRWGDKDLALAGEVED
jgi:hypothetical protein